MALFGRSKKTKESKSTTKTNSRPPTTPPFHHTAHSRTQSTPNPPNGAYYEQRPYTSHGAVVQQPQVWPAQPYLQPQGQYADPRYLNPHPNAHPLRPKKSSERLGRFNASVNNLLQADMPPCLSPLQMQGTQYLNQGAALCDQIASKLNEVITLIDGERFSGNESQMLLHNEVQIQQQPQPETTSRGMIWGKSKEKAGSSIYTANTTTSTSTNYFSKVNFYANSRLPPNLPPLKLYMPTYPLLCLAAQFSERVYIQPAGKERDAHVDADWRMGTKAMVIKSVPMDDMNTIVFAIRGSQTFMDWAVNLNSSPAVPNNFLDDPGNLCHAGFLTVARKMIGPVAARLRDLLQEDPSRARCSLLITGHSAGGAVAALLYSHMLATTKQAQSELNMLTGCFKRIHCVTFGAPPVSLLPLATPKTLALRKSLFLSFVNEGDPVPRADKAYIRSLLDLYSSAVPGQSCLNIAAPAKLQPLITGFSKSSLAVNKYKHQQIAPPVPNQLLWKVPEATLSCAGRIILLRSIRQYDGNTKQKTNEMMNEGVVAQTISDDLLRGVIWGDPVCHMMKLYARRIEILATNAVMGRS